MELVEELERGVAAKSKLISKMDRLVAFINLEFSDYPGFCKTLNSIINKQREAEKEIIDDYKLVIIKRKED